MLITGTDLDFLCKETKLSEVKLLSLLEDDEDLMLEVIASNPRNEICLTISFPLFVKMVILSETKDKKNLTNIEKDYITNTVSTVYPKIYNRSIYISDKKSVGETDAQFYLVLAGLFPEKLKRIENRGAPSPDYYIRFARKLFQHANKPSIAEHIYDWIGVLNHIKETHWSL